MTADLALTVVEIAALLLTVILVGVQLAARQVMSEEIDPTLLEPVVSVLDASSLGLLLAAVFGSTWAYMELTGLVPRMAVAALVIPLVAMSWGINKAAARMDDRLVREEHLQESDPNDSDTDGESNSAADNQ